MILTSQSRKRIHSLDDCLQYALPAKEEQHWKDDRIAKELAKAWMNPSGPSVPSEIVEILSTHPDTAS